MPSTNWPLTWGVVVLALGLIVYDMIVEYRSRHDA